MKVAIRHEVPASETYRAARVKSLFNATDEQATRFYLDADLPIDDDDWRIGVVVGPSGSGKSSIGRALWGGGYMHDPGEGWPTDRPIVDAIAPAGDFDAVTGALAQAGLGDVPVWLRPYHVLSTGQKFRADLARILATAPDRVVVDEFTSVVDRQIAQVGAGAFSKAWKRTRGQAVLLTCHYDVLDWLEPDWVFDTSTGTFSRGSVQHRRPRIDVEVRLGGWNLWPLFKPHHYLDAGPMPGGRAYVALVNDEPVAHLGMSTRPRPMTVDGEKKLGLEGRACRMVVMPEWQGAGVGMRFLNHVCELQRIGEGVHPGRRLTTVFHTSHPQLCAALRRDPKWVQVSAALYGGNKKASAASMRKAAAKKTSGTFTSAPGYGGHLRAVQGFRYHGVRP